MNVPPETIETLMKTVLASINLLREEIEANGQPLSVKELSQAIHERLIESLCLVCETDKELGPTVTEFFSGMWLGALQTRAAIPPLTQERH